MSDTFIPKFLSASEYVLALHNPRHRVAVLTAIGVDNRHCNVILAAETIAGIPFHTWLREQNEAGANICVTWNRTGWFVLLLAASWFGPDQTLQSGLVQIEPTKERRN